jgi:hypothetical protein
VHLTHALAMLAGDALYVLPAVALLGWLWLTRRYPGEEILARLAARRSPRERRPAAERARLPRPVVRTVRSGRMLGSWLAVRPPPLALAS